VIVDGAVVHGMINRLIMPKTRATVRLGGSVGYRTNPVFRLGILD